MNVKLSKRFQQVYTKLAESGQCDAWGGAESQRLLKEWETAKCPALIGTFIKKHANKGPTPAPAIPAPRKDTTDVKPK